MQHQCHGSVLLPTLQLLNTLWYFSSFEKRYAITKTIENSKGNLPYLLKYYKENYELSKEELLSYYNENNNVPEEFENILKEKLF